MNCDGSSLWVSSHVYVLIPYSFPWEWAKKPNQGMILMAPASKKPQLSLSQPQGTEFCQQHVSLEDPALKKGTQP